MLIEALLIGKNCVYINYIFSGSEIDQKNLGVEDKAALYKMWATLVQSETIGVVNIDNFTCQ